MAARLSGRNSQYKSAACATASFRRLSPVKLSTQTGPSRWSGRVAFSPVAGDLKRGHPGARRPSDEVPTVRSPHSLSVPKTMLATYDSVAALTDTFCCDKLNDEYRDLARAMTAALCRKRPSPLASGQRRTWACSIYVLGQINFLSDKATQPYMAASVRGRRAPALHAHCMDPAWMLPSLVDQNPLVWMAEVNGVLVDLLDMPRELQRGRLQRLRSRVPRRSWRSRLSSCADAP
jgi:Domain of unknown function (DUF6398)